MELFKKINDWPDYEISNLGVVRSLKFGETRILKQSPIGPKRRQYMAITLCSGKSTKMTIKVHKLVGLYFVHNPFNLPVLNHIDHNPFNNHFLNLEWSTNRHNVSHGYKNKKTSSEHTGVFWSKKSKKWGASVTIEKKQIHLGFFTDELEAAEKYQTAIFNLKDSPL